MRLVLIGVAAGFLSALFGVGGGILVVPLLILAARYQPRPAMATSLAAIGITALAGTIVYAFAGKIDPALALLVGVPSAAGATVGTALQQRASDPALSYLFALFLVGVAVALLIA